MRRLFGPDGRRQDEVLMDALQVLADGAAHRATDVGLRLDLRPTDLEDPLLHLVALGLASGWDIIPGAGTEAFFRITPMGRRFLQEEMPRRSRRKPTDWRQDRFEELRRRAAEEREQAAQPTRVEDPLG